jgi:hypothetical protein
VHYSHCSKLGRNRPYDDRSEIPCPVLPFSKSMNSFSAWLCDVLGHEPLNPLLIYWSLAGSTYFAHV